MYDDLLGNQINNFVDKETILTRIELIKSKLVERATKHKENYNIRETDTFDFLEKCFYILESFDFSDTSRAAVNSEMQRIKTALNIEVGQFVRLRGENEETV